MLWTEYREKAQLFKQKFDIAKRSFDSGFIVDTYKAIRDAGTSASSSDYRMLNIS